MALKVNLLKNTEYEKRQGALKNPSHVKTQEKKINNS